MNKLPKFIMMCGLPGAGKSTYCNQFKDKKDYIIVSSDSIRAELGDINDQSKNNEVFKILYERIKGALKNGFNVKHILDDYSIASQENLESELLDKYFSDRAQITMDSLIGNGVDEREMIEEGYKLANKEIGYRIEKLKNK